MEIRLESIRIPFAFLGLSRLEEAILSPPPQPRPVPRDRCVNWQKPANFCLRSYGVHHLEYRTMEGLRTELPELYRELQLLRLKYEHLADVCRKLTKSW